MRMTIGERLLPWAFVAVAGIGATICVAMEIQAQSAPAAVAVAHRHTQARTDAQPTLPDDLANDKKRPDGSGGLGNPASQDIGAVVGQALEAAKPAAREIIVHNMPPKYGPCPFCVQQKAVFGDGWGDVRVTYTDVEDPRFVDRGYPFVEIPDAGRVLSVSRVYQRAEIEAALREYKPPVIPQAVSVGKLQIRSTVRDILQRVEPGGIIRVGSATITLPETMQPQVKLPRQALIVTFAGQKPRLKYGAKWLAVGADINGFTLTDSLLTVSVAGLPDVSLVVE